MTAFPIIPPMKNTTRLTLLFLAVSLIGHVVLYRMPAKILAHLETVSIRTAN